MSSRERAYAADLYQRLPSPPESHERGTHAEALGRGGEHPFDGPSPSFRFAVEAS